MRTARTLTAFLVAVAAAAWLWPSTVHAAWESYAGGYDAISQVEKVLKQAAATSPQWHRKQESIQRDIHDLTFLLERAWRAAEQANDTAMKDYAHQALALLQRAVRGGHFNPAQIEPVLALIRRFVPNVPV